MAQTDVLTPPATSDHRRYALTAGTELLGEYQDSAYQEPKYLIQRVDGQTMQLPGLLYRVACALDGRNAGQIAEDLNAELGQDLTPDQVAFLIEERLYPAGIVALDGAGPGDADGAAPGPDHPEPAAVPMPVKSDLLLALRYRVGVIPAGVASRIGRVLQPLFARPLWTTLVAVFLAVDAAIIAGGDLLDQSVAGIQAIVERPVLILVLLGLTVVSGAFHEFGHVAACRYGGARPGNVGVGLYIVWPALYSDVTDSYRLDRVGRLRTDLGGVYFDAIFMAAVGLVYLRTGEPWLLIALVGMHVEMAWQFLPSIRLDGYYILADLVGVPDLFGYVKPALLSTLPGRPVHPRVAELKPRARRLVVGWVLIVIPTLFAWLVVFLVAAPRILPAAWQSLMDYLDGLDAAVRTGDLVTTSLGVFQMLLLALPWLGSVLILWMLADIVGQKRRARGAVPRMSPTAKASLRRWSSLALLVALSGLLVARVAAVAGSRPATADETRLVDAAVAAMHGAEGPQVSLGEWLFSAQLVVYASLTDAFERHTTAVAGARELSVLATDVLVFCLVGLVVLGRLRPIAVAVPVGAVLAMGPAVTELAAVGPGVLGLAWTALGALVLMCARRPAAVILAAVAMAVGLATEPLLAVPMSACAAVMLLRGELRWGRPAWWPPRDVRAGPAATGDGVRAAGRHRAAPRSHRGWDTGRGDVRKWLGLALLAAAGAIGAVLTTGRSGTSLDETERAVLVLLAAVIVTGALVTSTLRPPAVGAAVVVLLAALPWPGAGGAAFVALAALVLLAAVMIEAVVRRPVPQRPHPLLRGVVVVPAFVLAVVGALFQPSQAPALASAELATWISRTTPSDGTVVVPAGLWGDLVRDGVAPDRLVRSGSGAAAAAAWTVEVGEPVPGGSAVARFGTGAAALTVVKPLHVEARERAAAAERAAQLAAEQQAVEGDLAARQAFGSSLAGNPRLDAPDDVGSALRAGAVDSRLLALLAALTADHDVAIDTVSGSVGGVHHEIVVTQVDGRRANSPDVAAALTQWLAAVPPSLSPERIISGSGGMVVGWSVPAPETPPGG